MATYALIVADPTLTPGWDQATTQCDAPEYFGICDPFVPGIIITPGESAPVVLRTWAGGPAERGGICPGDQILAVNGVSARDHTFRRLLRELVSDAPRPVRLDVLRGERPRKFEVIPVRESTLAHLVRSKFLRLRVSTGIPEPVLVPLTQTREEAEQVESLLAGIDERLGYKWVRGFWVPAKTPDSSISRLASALGGSTGLARIRQKIGFPSGPGEPWAGFLVALLENPQEALIEQVFPNSPAHRAGVLPGDRLIAINGRAVSLIPSSELGRLLASGELARKMELELVRGDARHTVILEMAGSRDLAALDSYSPIPETSGMRSSQDYILGLSVLFAQNPGEARIVQVDFPSPAFEAGLHVGDLVLTICGKSIDRMSREKLSMLLTPSGPAEISLEVIRQGEKLSFRLRPTTYGEALASIGRKLTRFGPAPTECAD